MAAGAEGQARIEFQNHGGRVGRVVPRRHDPDLLADADRLELGLRQPHPILICHVAQRVRRCLDAERIRRSQHHQRGVGFLVEQGHHARAVPRELGGLQSWLSKERLLVRRIGVGVFHRYRQRAEVEQCIGPGFGLILRNFDHTFLESHEDPL